MRAPAGRALMLLGAAPDAAPIFERGDRALLLALPLFTNDHLGHACEEDLNDLHRSAGGASKILAA